MLAEKPSTPNTQLRWRATRRMPASIRVYGKPRYASRGDAGKLLVRALKYYSGVPDTIVLSIKPSTTLLADEIAKGLNLPLDLFLIRSFKLNGLTVGAVSDRFDQPLLKEQIIRGCDISQETIDGCIAQERKVLATQREMFQPRNLQLPSGEQATIILATDGVQSGQDARNTIQMLRMMGYRGRIVLAAAVVGPDAQKMFKTMCTVVALSSPQIVGNVSWWFAEKEETHVETVRNVLKR